MAFPTIIVVLDYRGLMIAEGGPAAIRADYSILAAYLGALDGAFAPDAGLLEFPPLTGPRARSSRWDVVDLHCRRRGTS